MRYTFLFILSFLCFQASGQNKILKENLIIKTNKKVFITGEELNLGIHSLTEQGETSNLSKVVYLELIDRTGKARLQQKILLYDGKGEGLIYLPSTLETGNYTLVAYTRWMQNFSELNYSRTLLSVFNPFRPIVSEEYQETPRIALFPESGTFFQGIDNRVIYTIQSPDSISIKEMKILDTEGKEILSRNTSQSMGEFEWNPTVESAYRVILLDDKDQIYFDDIEVRFSPVHIQVQSKNNAFHITPYFKSGMELRVNGITKTNVVPGESFQLEKTELITGVNEISIWKKEEKICRRLFFVRPERVSIDYDVTVRGARKNSTLQVKPVEEEAIISVSIRKTESYRSKEHPSDDRYLKPKGIVISDPSQMGNKTYLDRQLILYSEPDHYQSDPLLLPEIRGPIIAGKIKGNDSLNLDQRAVYLTGSDSRVVHTTYTDPEGQFLFTDANYGPESQLSISSDLIKEGGVLEVNSGFTQRPLDPVTIPLVVEDTWLDEIQEHSVQVQLENAYFEFKSDSLIPLSGKDYFYGTPTKSYLLSDYTQFPTLRDVIREYINEVSVRGKDENPKIFTSFQQSLLQPDDSTLILLNGLPVSNSRTILSLNPALVEKIEVVFQNYVYGNKNMVGIVNFITFSPIYQLNVRDPGLQIINYQGIEFDRIQYIPDHNSGSEKDERIPDLRRQLLWIPSWEINDSIQSVEFFTSDLKGTFEIIISGYTKSGKVIFEQKEFDVN